jgi:hypothetical protein
LTGPSWLNSPRVGWVALAVAMVVASVVVLRAGRDLAFGADELNYFGRIVDSEDGAVPYGFGLEYLLAPHNGHLQIGGKLIYEASFAIFGAARLPLQLVELAGLFACVALFFELCRSRVGVPMAFVAAVAILFAGAAWEVMLWPFDLHTVLALAAGLGAVLALDRGGRRGELAACVLLVVSLAMIEVGLAFVAAAAIMVVFGGSQRRRVWVFLVPVVLYAGWWVWARRFDHEDVALSNLGDLPRSLAESLTAVTAALTGLFAHGPGVFPTTLDPDPAAAVLAGLLGVALAVAYWRRPISVRGWALLAALAVYWVLIALADRPSDSSRYIWAGLILVLAVAAEALAGSPVVRRYGPALAVALAVVVAIAMPPNLDKLADGREYSLSGSRVVGADFAMLELAGDRGDPHFNPAADPFVSTGLEAGVYLEAARRIGSLALGLEEVRALDPAYRAGADRTLVRALGVEARPASPPNRGGCETPSAPGQPVELPPGGAVLGGGEGGALAIGRFSGAASVPVAQLVRDGWLELRLAPDAAPEPWLAFGPRGMRVCPLP